MNTFKFYTTTEYLREKYESRLKHSVSSGVDRISPLIFSSLLESEIEIIKNKCQKGTYKFSPYREILQSKGRRKEPRVISIPTVRDKLLLSCLKDFLFNLYPKAVNHRLPNVYIREMKLFFESCDIKKMSFAKTDINKFYDSIDHTILLQILSKKIKSKKVLEIIKNAISNATVPRHYKRNQLHKFRNSSGIPQGLPISNILADIYLLEFDKKIEKKGSFYRRYVDDIIMFSEQKKPDKTIEMIAQGMQPLKLTLNLKDKTEVGKAVDSFEYLGYNICYQKIGVRLSTFDHFIISIASIFSKYNHDSQLTQDRYKYMTPDIQKSVFISDLNEKITGAISEDKRYGWLFYFIELTDLSQLFKADLIIKGLFYRLPQFEKKAPKNLKSMVKAFYHAKYKPNSGYIHNYNIYDSIPKKLQYLTSKGLLNPSGKYSEKQIEEYFDRFRAKHLSNLMLDVGLIS